MPASTTENAGGGGVDVAAARRRACAARGNCTSMTSVAPVASASRSIASRLMRGILVQSGVRSGSERGQSSDADRLKVSESHTNEPQVHGEIRVRQTLSL